MITIHVVEKMSGKGIENEAGIGKMNIFDSGSYRNNNQCKSFWQVGGLEKIIVLGYQIVITQLRLKKQFHPYRMLSMNLKICSILLICFAFTSCNAHSDGIAGRYANKNRGILDRVFDAVTGKNASYAIGNKLILNTDSSFEYHDCGSVVYGNWDISKKDDTLKIFCRRYKSQSVDSPFHSCFSTTPWHTFKIRGNGNLVDYFYFKGKLIYNILSKSK